MKGREEEGANEPRVLVIRREACRVGAARGDALRGELAEGVDARASGGGGVHEVHF